MIGNPLSRKTSMNATSTENIKDLKRVFDLSKDELTRPGPGDYDVKEVS